MASNASPQLPNPFTPMAFLPPDIAFEVTVASYILVGSLGVLIWDILNNLSGDYKLLTKHRVGPPTLAYFLSRIGSLAYVLGSTIFETAHAGNCATFEKVVCALYPVAIPATSLLFFFRVRAVFDSNKYVIAFFAFMWLAVLGGCITVTRGVTGINIGPTDYCLNAALENYVSAAAIIPLVNDTLVFLAISFRLMTNTHIDYNIRSGVKTLVFGEYLPAFSKTLFQDGQVYYLTTVTTNLLTVIMLYVTAVPITYRTMFTVPNITLMNIMACRVFRNTKLGMSREPTISSNSKLMSRGETPTTIIPLSLRKGNQSRAAPHKEINGVEITKTIEHDYDISDKESRESRYTKEHTMV
ncbi:hypothetical protein GALMADRAFT_125223 [Galerina marginata CBS 339.88]|uniref:G-protein coupled receptors family 1 profile domain-containing protein n=1 Tax=Galerina marginata (strain CBS 339.88) TaxID=685588 RepID=A0A067SSX8_GALM3|nr:hypothetical protein GALMADRAFT_125223 [Galerina marginata CBS 339.88]